MLVNLAFFGSYGLWSLVYFIYSLTKGDPINKLGYKNGAVLGLMISSLACFLFYPATSTGSYLVCLIPLFLLGLGFTLLQISCNPYVTILGPTENASSRLNLAQGFNSLGTIIGPMILGFLILKYFSGNEAVQVPYAILGAVFGICAVLIFFLRLPEFKQTNTVRLNSSALQFRHLKLGMVAIFFYVGAEVAIGSKLIEYLGMSKIAGIDKSAAACYIGLYWGGAMIGRLTVSVLANQNIPRLRSAFFGLTTIASCFAFLLLAMTMFIGLEDRGLYFEMYDVLTTFHIIKPLLIFIAVQFLIMLIYARSSKKLLVIFSMVIIALLLFAFVAKGSVAMWCMIAIGLFNSVMWSNIFTLAIEDLKEYTSQGSSLLIIMISGGAVLPMLVGWISDNHGLIVAYLLPIISYIYIALFGAFGTLRHTK